MMMNPVLRREIKTSLRNWKIYTAISVYVFLVAFAALFYIWAVMLNAYMGSFNPQNVVMMYGILSGFQMGLILITTPALTAGSISGERERQTLDLLLMTKMTPLSIVLGKLFSSLGIVVLMTIATLPVFAILFYFGGVSLLKLLAMTGYLLLLSLMVGAVSVFLSTVFKKTVVSMVVMYCIIGFLCGGTLIMTLLYNVSYWSINQTGSTVGITVLMLAANPGVGFLSLLDKQMGFYAAQQFFDLYQSTTTYINPITVFCVNHFWLVNCFANAVITVIFVNLAAKGLNPKGRK